MRLNRETFKVGLMAAAMGTSFLPACGIEWLNTVDDTFADAATKHRPALLFFTGSDWSPRSMTLDKQVFEDKAFGAFITASFSTYQVDFSQRIPSGGPLLMKACTDLAEKHNIRHFPTVLALTPEGKEIGRFEYSHESAAEMKRQADAWLASFTHETTGARPAAARP